MAPMQFRGFSEAEVGDGGGYDGASADPTFEKVYDDRPFEDVYGAHPWQPAAKLPTHELDDFYDTLESPAW